MNPNIAMQDISPKIESPMNALAKVLQIKQAQQDTQLGQMKMDEHRVGQERTNSLRQLLGGFGADHTANEQKLLQGGFMKESQDYAKNRADINKIDGEAQYKKIETAHKKIDLMGQAFGFVKDNPSAENAMRATDYLVQNGIMTEEQAQATRTKIAADPSPETIRALSTQAYQSALSTKDQLPKLVNFNAGDREVNQSINPVTSKATETGSTVIRQSADNAATQATSRSNNAATIANAARTANMTDSRARDFNATTVEANNIKRAEVQGVKDMTKGGQLASFDTMLGTLDRLGKHPGLSRSVGMVGALPTMPGSDSANFQAELNTFQSQAFLPMVAQLKGMGALSDAEGKKLTQAVGALDTKMGEKAIRESIARITNEMNAARDRVAGVKSAPANGAYDDQSKEARYQAWKAKQ